VSLAAIVVAGLALAFLVDLPWPVRVAIVAAVLVLAAGPFLLDRSASRTLRRHHAEFEAWATGAGLTYEPSPDQPEWVRWLPWRPHATVGPAATGTYEGRDLTVAEYSRSRAQPHGGVVREAMVVCAVPLARSHPDLVVDLPSVARWWPGRQVARFRTGEVAFDRRFRVRAEDPDHAAELLGPELRTGMLAHELPLWEVHGKHLLVTWPFDLRPAEMPERLAATLRLAALIDQSG
jgi:hypothetical protein